jgi:hypothetical protein
MSSSPITRGKQYETKRCNNISYWRFPRT